MKKIIALLLAVLMLLTLAACGEKTDNNDAGNTETTVGSTLLADFNTKTGTAQEIADALLQNEIIQFMGATMPVEEGLLNGFGETEIKGFKEGVMFAPMIGTIPFVGYIFTLEDGADVNAFKTTLKDNANLRWNICTEAEELIVESKDNTVFFLMCPKSFEQPETEGDAGVGGMDLPMEEGIPAEDGITLE
ncbi:MAG: hypothetical protein IJP27_08605 [Clostridia bacterium]|nr:hypothetical protein [Clostridia bacterium]